MTRARARGRPTASRASVAPGTTWPGSVEQVLQRPAHPFGAGRLARAPLVGRALAFFQVRRRAQWLLGCVAILCVVAVFAFAAADRWLPSAGTRAILPATLGVLAGCAALAVAVAVEIVAHWQSGLRPETTAYGAMVYLAGLLAAQVVAAVVFMGLFTAARLVAGRTDRERRNSFDHTALLAYYAAAQTLLGLAVVHVFPRLVG